MRNALKLMVLVTLLAVPSIAAAAGSGRTLAINCTKEQFKPKTIFLACGDGGIWLSKLTWSSWTGSKASGSGTYNANDCTPDCATGHVKSYPVKVTLTKPMTCAGQTQRAFKQAAFTYTGTHPVGAPTRRTFPCPPGLPGGC